ncbi:MAG: sugar phosphate isomerase/epimerase [Acidobacteriota bacterium]
MRLAFHTPYDPVRLDEVTRLGIDAIQLRLGPGFALDLDDASDAAFDAAARDLTQRGLEVVTLGFYRNMLEPDRNARELEMARLRRVMRLAGRFGTRIVGVFAGRDPDRTIVESVEDFVEAWTPAIREAEDLDLVLAIENCTMFRGHRLWSINFAHTPSAFDQLFTALPSPALGIELDPSHLHKQGLDPVAFVERFGERIVHVHAKDHEHLPDLLAEHGRFSLETSRDRFPGKGEIDFAVMIAALLGVGYDGAITIEAERDPEATDEASRFRLLQDAVDVLAPLV